MDGFSKFKRNVFRFYRSDDRKNVVFENLSNSSNVMSEKPVSEGHFRFFLAKPEVDFRNQRWCALFPVKPEFMPFEF